MRIGLIVGVLALAGGGGCASCSSPPERDAGAKALTGAVRVYEADERPDCPHVIVGEVVERGGALDAGGRLRMVEGLRAQARRLGGHAIVDLRESVESSEVVLSGTVIRFVKSDCVR